MEAHIITYDDVKQFIKQQNTVFLQEIKVFIDLRIEEMKEQDAHKNALRSISTKQIRKPLDKAIIEPVNGIIVVNNVVDKITSKIGRNNLPHEKRKLTAISADETTDNILTGYNTCIFYMQSDNYGDALVKIKDEKFLQEVMKLHKDCKSKGWYFPFGFGETKDQLKIKKYKQDQKFVELKVKLKFSKWDMSKDDNEKIGYSCYIIKSV